MITRDIYTEHTHPYGTYSKERFKKLLHHTLIEYTLDSNNALYGELEPSFSLTTNAFAVYIDWAAILIHTIRVTEDPVNWIEFEFTFLDTPVGNAAKSVYLENPSNLIFIPRIIRGDSGDMLITIDCWHRQNPSIYYRSEDGAMVPSETIDRKDETGMRRVDSETALRKLKEIANFIAPDNCRGVITILRDTSFNVQEVAKRQATWDDKNFELYWAALAQYVQRLRDKCDEFLEITNRDWSLVPDKQNPYTDAITEDLVD